MKSWIEAIDRAATEAEVVATARDYCSLFSPRELAPFPEDCREIRIDGTEDIPRWRDKIGRNLEAVRDRLEEHSRVPDLLTCLERADARLGSLRKIQ